RSRAPPAVRPREFREQERVRLPGQRVALPEGEQPWPSLHPQAEQGAGLPYLGRHQPPAAKASPQPQQWLTASAAHQQPLPSTRKRDNLFLMPRAGRRQPGWQLTVQLVPKVPRDTQGLAVQPQHGASADDQRGISLLADVPLAEQARAVSANVAEAAF